MFILALDFGSAWPLLLFAALPAVGSGVARLSFPLVVPGGLVALLPVLPAWALPDMPAPDGPELPMPELEPLMPEFAALPAVGAGVVRLSVGLVVPGGLVAALPVLPAWALPDVPAPDAPELPMPELDPLMPELVLPVPVADGIVVA